MPQITDEGATLFKQWQNAIKYLDIQKENLIRAERCLQTAEEHLAMWLLPDDSKEGEQFCVWHGDSLIVAEELPGDGGYRVSVRTRGRSLA